jgi:hypothetical protein
MQPCPSYLVKWLTLGDGTAITIRPIRPEDEELEQEIMQNLSDELRTVNRQGRREKPHISVLVSRVAMVPLLVTGRRTVAHSIK